MDLTILPGSKEALQLEATDMLLAGYKPGELWECRECGHTHFKKSVHGLYCCELCTVVFVNPRAFSMVGITTR